MSAVSATASILRRVRHWRAACKVDIMNQISAPTMQGFPIFRVVRYLIVGATANLLVLGIHYGATFGAGLHHKASLFLASAIGFAVSYASNRAWTFQFKGKRIGSVARFGAGYGASFAVQWMILHIGADVLMLPHQWVVLFG